MTQVSVTSQSMLWYFRVLFTVGNTLLVLHYSISGEGFPYKAFRYSRIKVKTLWFQYQKGMCNVMSELTN